MTTLRESPAALLPEVVAVLKDVLTGLHPDGKRGTLTFFLGSDMRLQPSLSLGCQLQPLLLPYSSRHRLPRCYCCRREELHGRHAEQVPGRWSSD